MLKKMLVMVCLVSVGLFPSLVFADSEITELRSREEAAGGAGGAGERIDRVLCVGGLKVMQTVVFGVGNGSGAAVSNLQLFEERDGKVVPVTCEASTSKKK